MKHGQSNSRIYHTYKNMKQRCYNPNDPKFISYGGRGIEICQEWLDDFNKFYEWSMTNGYADDLTIDRIENDKGYSPNNCRWITFEENRRNRTYSIDKNKLECKLCGELTMNVDSICPKCKINIKRRELKELGILKKIQNIDITLLNDEELQIFDDFLIGKTLRDIGNQRGVTIQSIRYKFSKLVEKKEHDICEFDYGSNSIELSILDYLRKNNIKISELARCCGIRYKGLYNRLVISNKLNADDIIKIGNYLDIDFKSQRIVEINKYLGLTNTTTDNSISTEPERSPDSEAV